VEVLLARETIDGAEVYALAGRPLPEGGARISWAPARSGVEAAPGALEAAGPDRDPADRGQTGR